MRMIHPPRLNEKRGANRLFPAILVEDSPLDSFLNMRAEEFQYGQVHSGIH